MNFPFPRSWKFKEERLHAIDEIRPKLKNLTNEMLAWGFHYTEIFWRALGDRRSSPQCHQARPSGGRDQIVQLNYLISADYVLAEVIDEGPGFDPKTVPNPFVARQQGQVAKRGLFFMSLFMSWVRFEGRGNRVTLCKMRSPRKGDSGFPDN